MLRSVDELSEAGWCCVSWCWCCIGRGKSISVFVSQCPGGGSQGYERDLLVDLRLLWPPANCTDIFRIFSDNLGSVKLLSFRTDHPVSPSVEHNINSQLPMWGQSSAFCLRCSPSVSCPHCPGERGLTTSGQREIKMERRGQQLWRLLQFCNEHKKWKHIRYYPALVNLSMLHASTSYKIENLQMAVNVSRRVCVGRIVINFLKVLLMGGLRSNLIILSPLHRLYRFSLVEICEKIPWLADLSSILSLEPF